MSKTIKTLFAMFLIANIILFSDKITTAAYNSLYLWFNVLIPALFPFMVISSWLDFGSIKMPAFINRICIYLFGVKSNLIPVFLISFLCGYPVGAKIISQMYSDKKISVDTAEHLLSFCNNPGVVLIISVVSTSMLSDQNAALFFIIICVFSSLLTAIIYNRVFPLVHSANTHLKTKSSSQITLYSSISSAVKSILIVGGCIIFFSVISEIVLNLIPLDSQYIKGIISGILEFINGMKQISSSNIDRNFMYSIIAAILSWGGLSVHLQTSMVMENNGISIKKYMICKALSSFISFITAFFTYEKYFSKIQTTPVFNHIQTPMPILLISIIISTVIFLFCPRKKSN